MMCMLWAQMGNNWCCKQYDAWNQTEQSSVIFSHAQDTDFR